MRGGKCYIPSLNAKWHIYLPAVGVYPWFLHCVADLKIENRGHRTGGAPKQAAILLRKQQKFFFQHPQTAMFPNT